LREEFVHEMVEEFNAIGLRVPDPNLSWNEVEERWQHGPIDWDEFWEVVRGNGPMNAARLAARRKAHTDGTWVREAMAGYAQRQHEAVEA
jgi:ring-1,2-phenylacetyl-CoA epoxidase subunit PaaA